MTMCDVADGLYNPPAYVVRSVVMPHRCHPTHVQALGYAEADPTFDVQGIDAAHKLTILSAIGFGIPMQFDK